MQAMSSSPIVVALAVRGWISNLLAVEWSAGSTWTLSEHTSGRVVVLEHEVPLDELYDGVAVAAGP
jgi:hypothetical protein